MTRIFDFHARLVRRPHALRRLLSTMDDNGIARAAVAAGGLVDLDRLSGYVVDGGHTTVPADNEGVLDACAATGGRLLPFYFANPHDGSRPYQDQAARFRGLELSPAVHGVGLDDRRVAALVEVAAQAAHPVYLVCLGRAGSHARDLVALAKRFPTVAFVFGHCGFIGIDAHAISVVAGRENIVAETSGCFTVTARLALDRLGPDRVLFGTEYPLQHPGVELAKFAALDLDAATWRLVAWDNAHRLMGEEPS